MVSSSEIILNFFQKFADRCDSFIKLWKKEFIKITEKEKRKKIAQGLRMCVQDVYQGHFVYEIW